MNNGFRIPTVLAFLLVGGLVAILGIFSDDARILLGRAATPSGTIPQSVEVLNITDSSAVVFWKSTAVVASTLVIPTSNSTFYDVRDTDALAKPYIIHMYILNNLPAQKTSAFEIKTGSQTVYKGTVLTSPPLAKIPQAVPLYGSVPPEITENQVFIKATINNEATTITYTTTPKNWALPISTIRTKDANSYYCTEKCTDDTPILLTFMTEKGTAEKKATLATARPYSTEEEDGDTSVLSSTSVMSPTIEPTKSSQTPTPTRKMLPTPAKQKSTPTPTSTSTPIPKKIVLGANSLQKEEIAITSPTDGQALSFTKPLIRGTGISGHDVTITLSGVVTQIGKTKVTDKSTWQWNPAFPLSSGKYTLTIVTTDKSNKKVSRTHSFIVLKSGESVLSASTPSATLIPFPTETPTPTILVDIPTATPTIFVTAGPEVSLFFIGGGSLLLLFALVLL